MGGVDVEAGAVVVHAQVVHAFELVHPAGGWIVSAVIEVRVR